MASDRTYDSPVIQRRYDLAKAMIEFKSHTWGHIDTVADTLTQEQINTFAFVIDRLNSKV